MAMTRGPVNVAMGAVAPPSSPLDEAVSQLERLVSILMDNWQIMRTRLEPVLTTSETPQTPRDVKLTAIGDSPITMRIRNEGSRIDALADDMVNILNRLEV